MCVLLVEDEPVIREIMAESLQDAGYDVMEARDGDQAIGLMDDAQGRFTILVTDLHMPGSADGTVVAARLRELRPGIPVIITTGRPDVLAATWREADGYTLLRKPYLPSRLVMLVRSLISHPSPG